MVALLDVAEFKLLSTMPKEQVDRLAQLHPGWLEAQLADRSTWVSSRLAKRFRVPFSAPYSPTVQGWIAQMVTLRAYIHHGVVATDEQMELITKEAEKAEAEVKEAADGSLSLIDLAPSDQSRDRVEFGGVLSYSEASPYVQYDIEADRGHREDSSRRGSGGGPNGQW